MSSKGGLPLPDMEWILEAMERKDHELASLITNRAVEDSQDYMMKTMKEMLLKSFD